MRERIEYGTKMESPYYVVKSMMSSSARMPYVPIHRYHYYDTPGGQDLFKKICATSPFMSLAFGAYGLHETVLKAKPTSVAGAISRMMYWTGPPFAVAAAFCTGTYVACNIRHKDDELSHFIGGVCAGPVVGAWRSCVFSGFCFSIILGVFAVVRKHCNDNGWSLIPDGYPIVSGSVRSVKHDWSLLKDGNRGWTTNPDEA